MNISVRRVGVQLLFGDIPSPDKVDKFGLIFATAADGRIATYPTFRYARLTNGHILLHGVKPGRWVRVESVGRLADMLDRPRIYETDRSSVVLALQGSGKPRIVFSQVRLVMSTSTTHARRGGACS